MDGFRCELQFTTCFFQKAKKPGHRTYEQLRFLTEHLLLAAIDNDERAFDILVNACGELVPEESMGNLITKINDASGHSAVHFAALHGNLQMCKKMVEAGADISTCSPGGDLPLVGGLCDLT